jgi:hypothetical protein
VPKTLKFRRTGAAPATMFAGRTRLVHAERVLVPSCVWPDPLRGAGTKAVVDLWIRRHRVVHWLGGGFGSLRVLRIFEDV